MSAGNSDITININIGDVEKFTRESVLAGLEACGLQIESYAKLRLTENGSVDTGLLRNSIAHAVSGEQPSIGTSYKGTTKKARSYKADKPGEDGDVKSGTYTGHAPKATDDPKVYVGTNVYYAPYVEMGHKQGVGRYGSQSDKKPVASEVKAKPYLRPAFTEHMDEFKDIMANFLREAAEEFNNSS